MVIDWLMQCSPIVDFHSLGRLLAQNFPTNVSESIVRYVLCNNILTSKMVPSIYLIANIYKSQHAVDVLLRLQLKPRA